MNLGFVGDPISYFAEAIRENERTTGRKLLTMRDLAARIAELKSQGRYVAGSERAYTLAKAAYAEAKLPPLKPGQRQRVIKATPWRPGEDEADEGGRTLGLADADG